MKRVGWEWRKLLTLPALWGFLAPVFGVQRAADAQRTGGLPNLWRDQRHRPGSGAAGWTRTLRRVWPSALPPLCRRP